MNSAIAKAAELLRECAADLKLCHTVDGSDWAGEDEAKAAHDEYLAVAAALEGIGGPWCCEKGQAARVQVCDECAAESAGYSAAMAPEPDDTPLETGEGDARDQA